MTHPVLRAASLASWAGLGLWFAAITSAGIAASSVFPNLEQLTPSLPGWAANPDRHHRYAAGVVMEQVFFVVDLMQVVAILLVAGALIAQAWADPGRRRSAAFRTRAGLIVVAIAAFTYHATVLAPRMNRALRGQWQAAKAGDAAEADRLAAVFEPDHRTAFSLQRTIFVLVIGAAALAAWEVGGPVSSREAHA